MSITPRGFRCPGPSRAEKRLSAELPVRPGADKRRASASVLAQQPESPPGWRVWFSLSASDRLSTVDRLANATSPHPQQHAESPVDLWPWGPEPFAEAEQRGVPVLLSVGYAACHWCH
ncbi:hypothetical protein GCM10025734_51410 [Kitasatospora paranensis]